MSIRSGNLTKHNWLCRLPRPLVPTFFAALLIFAASPVYAKYASYVMDAQTGRVIHEINAVQRPANVLRDVLAVILPYVDGEFKDALE